VELLLRVRSLRAWRCVAFGSCTVISAPNTVGRPTAFAASEKRTTP
jgi:hypothetical protein